MKFEKSDSREFVVSLGSFQGDSLSGKLFTLYLAGALRHLKAIVGCPQPPIDMDTMMPLETVYADDCDFYSLSETALTDTLRTVEKVFSNWNLIVNQSKTEFTNIYISEEKAERGNEDWRKSKILGSKICSKEGVKNRINLANVAFSIYKKCGYTANL